MREIKALIFYTATVSNDLNPSHHICQILANGHTTANSTIRCFVPDIIIYL